MDEEATKENNETLEEAKEIQKELGLASIDTALLIMIYETLDTIRFHNSD